MVDLNWRLWKKNWLNLDEIQINTYQKKVFKNANIRNEIFDDCNQTLKN
jgi:hypothetical protein